MEVLTSVLGASSLLALIYTFYILAHLSRRYGQVIKLPRYYRSYYVSTGLVCLALVSHLMKDSLINAGQQGPALLNNDWFYLLTYYLPMAVAVTIALGVAWRYWGWLLREQRE
jgi:hypothetical protein